MKHICCYGGAFDPVHRGHLFFARKIVESICPDALFFIPGFLSPFKNSGSHATAGQRLKMLELILPEVPCAFVCMAEIERGGLSYTIDTLKMLRERYPMARISWVIGDDHLDRLQEWKDYPRHITYCDFIVLPRLYEGAELKTRIAAHPLNKHLYPLESSRYPLSSTRIREACAKGEALSTFVPKAVEAYIRKHHLYGSAS